MDFNAQTWGDAFVAAGGNPVTAKSISDRIGSPANITADSRTSNIVTIPAPQLIVEQDLFSSDSAAPAEKTNNTSPAVQKTSLPTTKIVRRGRKPAALDAKPHTQQELDLFELSMEIDKKHAAESGDIGFLATAMIYAALPHSDVEGPIFKRKNGPVTLTIMNDPEIGLPYGKIPRIVTAFLCTEAKRHRLQRGREVFLGHSQAEFMEKLGMQSRGGKRGDIMRVHDQTRRLLTSTMQLRGEPGNHEFHWDKLDISPKGMLLWNPQTPDEKTKWESKLTLGESFYEECINHSIPLDMRVIHKLRSPLAIDIYVWLTYRYNSLTSPTRISWKQLKWQFGSNYSETAQGLSDFKTNFKAQLRNVLAIYREAKLDVQQDLVILLPSKPHVMPKLD